MSLYNRPINSSLPIQQVSYKKKFLDDKDDNGVTKWMKDSMDALESIGRYSFFNNIELRKNYEIMQGRFNIEDYVDDFDTYDLSTMVYQEMKLPSFLKHYDITTKAVKLLQGEFIKRPDIFRVVAKDIETSNEKLRIKGELVWSYVQESINKEITNKLLSQGLDPNKNDFKDEQEASEYKQLIEQKYQEFTPQSIEKYLTYDYRAAGEHWGQATLSDDIERFRIKEQDVLEFYHMCVSDRAFSHIYLTPSGYGIETWNPLTVFYQYNTQNRNIEDLGYCGRILYMSKTEIIDYFGWRMTKSQIESLYPEQQKEGSQGSVYKEAFNATMYPFADYREYDTLVTAMGQAVGETTMQHSPYGIPQFGFYPGTDGSNYIFTQADIVQVTQAYWKSQRKVGRVNYEDENGKIISTIVDETFNPKLFGIKELKESFKDSVDEPNTITWTWITETWQGSKINVNYKKMDNVEDRNAIYIDVKPCEFQFRGNDPRFIHNCKLPVIGNIFNNVNGRSQSVVDLLKPYQVLVNAFYNQAYHVAQKNNGKFFVMGASMLQSNKDWGGEEAQEKFMTIAQNLGLAIVDDSTPAQAQSMQYGLKVLDMDESDRITRLINLAMLIEQQGFMQLGITPQRQGTVQASETATGTQAAVNNSYAITEIYFEQFNNYRRRKLQSLLEMAQYVESQGEGDLVKQYTTSDLGRAFISVNKTDLLLKDLGIYLMNSAEQQRKKQIIEELILKNNQTLMPFSKLMDVVRMDSLSDIQKSIEEQEKQSQKQAQETQKQAMELEEKKLQMEAEEKQKDRENKLQVAQIQSQNRLDAITLQGIANEGSFSQETDTTDQLIAQRDIQLKESQANFQNTLQQSQITNDLIDSFNKRKLEESKLKQDKELKKNDAESKKKIENQKLEQIKTQNANQKYLADKKHQSDMAVKNKELEIKQLDKEIKLLDIKNAEKKANIETDKLKQKAKMEKELADLKASSIEKLTDVKIKEAEKLAKLKNAESSTSTSLKIDEIKQQHDFKLKENQEKHKENLKKIKIKPKLKK